MFLYSGNKKEKRIHGSAFQIQITYTQTIQEILFILAQPYNMSRGTDLFSYTYLARQYISNASENSLSIYTQCVYIYIREF